MPRTCFLFFSLQPLQIIIHHYDNINGITATHRKWSPSDRLRLHLLSRSGKIGPVTIPVTAPLHSQLTPRSQSPSGVPVNIRQDFVFAPRVTSSLPPTATIPALDFTSFTTDHPQTWRSPTPSFSTASSQNQQQHNFNQDFQLFAAPETPLRISPQASRAQAISSTAPNTQRLAQTRHLSINSRVSPVQSISSPSHGHLYSSPNHRSFPSLALQNQSTQDKYLRQLAHLQRLPPVPAFDSTTVPRRNYSVPNIPQGDMATAFDSMYLPGGDFSASHDDFLDLESNFQSNHFTTVNPGVNDGTISPTDLFKDDAMIMSAPPSAAFPNLSTPDSSFLESPAMASSGLNTSPLEDGELDATLNFAELDGMVPLFPQNGLDQFACQPLVPEPFTKSTSSALSSRPASAAQETGMARQKSSPGRPPSQPYHNRKRSETSGVSKTSKPRKNLPEITIESDDDKETAKRKKNTAAARKSRQRKQEHAEAAEAEIQRLRNIIYRLGADPDAESL
ncbi:Basic domain-containing protein [Cladophialophora immunda]|nr:Basic domain-containing protein [Cladophialophora immunda]